MIWLELRKNNKVYNEGWNFRESVWAPTEKDNGAQWPFWNLINDVKKNDLIVHLKHTNNGIMFTGYSYAKADAYVSHLSPTSEAHTWDFIDSYYKVDLMDNRKINPPVLLSDFFSLNDKELREYFVFNKARIKNKKRLFYVIQSGRLQCLNGAYFSEFDEKLIDLLLDGVINGSSKIDSNVRTGEKLAELKVRIGHGQFSENVKRNYNYTCCFPNCEIEGRGFLISGHITRWTDNKSMRGDTANGLCFCLLHDKAFEKGYFTLDPTYKIAVNKKYANQNEWVNEFLSDSEKQTIKIGEIKPSIKALNEHWQRIGYKK